MHSSDILDDYDFDPHLYLSGDEDGEVAAKYYSQMEAEVAAARLRSEGIPCFLANTPGQSVMPHVQSIIRLHTRQEDLERAKAILAESSLEANDGYAESRYSMTKITLYVLIFLLLSTILVYIYNV